MRFQLFEFAALSRTTQFLKPLSSSVGAQLSSCGSAVDSSHLILITLEEWHSCTSCLGDKLILIDIEINKSYFKLVQL